MTKIKKAINNVSIDKQSNEVNIKMNDKVNEVAGLLVELFDEIKNLLHIKVNKYAGKDEIKDLYLKVNLEKVMCFEVSLFNAKTNAMIIKPYDVMDLMTLCQLGMIDSAIDMDVRELYNKSKSKVFNEVTEILLD